VDEIVLRAMAKWPDVPDVYGWLELDRRGDWRLRSAADGTFERIANAGLREFICRNYDRDARGRWFFQNGPQRVYVRLAYTPLVARLEEGGLFDHCGRPLGEPAGIWLDDEGSIVLSGARGVAVLDDRDLERFAAGLPSQPEGLPRIARGALPGRFGFDPDPRP
jgi:hypothetical protein